MKVYLLINDCIHTDLRRIAMAIKIAVFGKSELITHMQDIINFEDDFEMVPFKYSKLNEVTSLIDHAFTCDTYVFLEPLAYFYCKNELEKKRIPSLHISVDEYMILMSFYRLNYIDNQDLNRLSIDGSSGGHILEVLTELHLHENNIYAYDYSHTEHRSPNIQDIIDFHKKLWEEDKIDMALTSIKEVEQRLEATGIPVRLMHIPQANIIDVLEQAKSVTFLNKNKSAQVVAGYISIKYIKDDNYKQQAIKHFHRVLAEFSKKTHTSILPLNQREFVLFGTRGILNHITSHYRDFPLLQQIKEFTNIEVDIGFGFGLTAKQAEAHAQIAMDKCQEFESGHCFIVNDQQELIGPIGVKKHFDTSRLYQALIHRARLNNELSYNFIEFIRTRNNEPFSSHDIASFYQVTKRSAERTVNKLLTGEVIKIVGEEKPYLKGRPRKLFQINI